MEESIKINKLEIENVKRVKAVKVEPNKNGLTVIGGKNRQGKTSVLDAITWALGGDRYKPSMAKREGSITDPVLRVVLSNGLVVERKGKNSSLKVTDPNGNKSGQQLLNEFVEELALNLPKFMEANGKEKADALLKIIGVGDQLKALELQEKEAYNERLLIGRDADRKKKFADEQPYYPDAPDELISASELIKQQQDILARNGENAKKRSMAQQYELQVTTLTDEVARIRQQLNIKEQQLNEATVNLSIAKTDAMDLIDESTEELERNIANVEAINVKVRANLDKEKAEEDARELQKKYEEHTKELEEIRQKKRDLLKNASLPLPELSVQDGEITYTGQMWDNMSGAERLKVATAIVRKLNPKCGFVLLDKLEQMDIDTMNEFGNWLKEQGLQAIATRVSTGSECSIVIEDGYVKEQDLSCGDEVDVKTTVQPILQQAIPTWKAGEF